VLGVAFAAMGLTDMGLFGTQDIAWIVALATMTIIFYRLLIALRVTRQSKDRWTTSQPGCATFIFASTREMDRQWLPAATHSGTRKSQARPFRPHITGSSEPHAEVPIRSTLLAER
jgi:hypothetical protein